MASALNDIFSKRGLPLVTANDSKTNRTDINNINNIIINDYPEQSTQESSAAQTDTVNPLSAEIIQLIRKNKDNPETPIKQEENTPEPEAEVLDGKRRNLRDNRLPTADNIIRTTNMPEEWAGVKLDLFNNGTNEYGTVSLKAKVCVIKPDRTRQSLVASLNSPYRFIKRGVDEDEYENNIHWAVVRTHHASIKKIYDDVRISKLVLPNNEKITYNVIMVYCDENNMWHFDIVREGIVHCFVVNEQVTSVQKQNNCIATAFYGRPKTSEKFVSNRDLGI